jgi:ABC-type amino acid transport/signal transduction systems, periplasmic component/domain
MAFRSLISVLLGCYACLAAAQPVDTLAKIKNSGWITQGVRDSSGLSYTLGGGKYTGFHYEMCQTIIKDLEKQIGRSLQVNYMVVSSQNRIPLVQNGTVDLECGSTTNNRARQKDVAFAYTTFVEEVRMAVRADSGIDSIKDLAGKTLVTTTGSTSVQILRKNKRAEGINFSEIFGKDHADSFLLLESGRADAFVIDSSILASSIAKSRNPQNFKIVGKALSLEPIAIMIPKDDPALKKAVDASIVRQIKSGDIERLYKKWFLGPVPPADVVINMPLSEATKEAWANPNDRPAEDYVLKD